MAYSDKVIDHYTNPRNVGTLDKSSHEGIASQVWLVHLNAATLCACKYSVDDNNMPHHRC